MIEEAIWSVGQVRFRVLGTSMAPSVLPGDLVCVQRAELGEISLGEIVLFSRDERLFVHRVVSCFTEGETPRLMTRGDRLDHNDPAVSISEFLGRVTSIQRGRRTFEPVTRLRGWNRLVARILRTSHFATRAYSYFFGSYVRPAPDEDGVPALSAKNTRRQRARRPAAVAEDV